MRTHNFMLTTFGISYMPNDKMQRRMNYVISTAVNMHSSIIVLVTLEGYVFLCELFLSYELWCNAVPLIPGRVQCIGKA